MILQGLREYKVNISTVLMHKVDVGFGCLASKIFF